MEEIQKYFQRRSKLMLWKSHLRQYYLHNNGIAEVILLNDPYSRYLSLEAMTLFIVTTYYIYLLKMKESD